MASLILGTASMAAQSLSLPSTLSSSKCISGFTLSIHPQNLALSSSSAFPSLPPIYCGRGDRKTAKGKRFAHSFGNLICRAMGSLISEQIRTPISPFCTLKFKPRRSVQACATSSEPLLVKAAKGLPVSRPPAWMMRQAGRYMAIYRKLAQKHPSFRERSETTDLIVEISLQPWEAFRPDGVIIFSDILTPLPAFGVPFDIEEVRGPVIQSPIRTEDDLKSLHPIDLVKLDFVGESLKRLRKEVDGQAALLGFVGAPWTIATYIVEGGTTRSHVHCYKEYVPYSAPCAEETSFTFGRGNCRICSISSELWSSLYTNI